MDYFEIAVDLVREQADKLREWQDWPAVDTIPNLDSEFDWEE